MFSSTIQSHSTYLRRYKRRKPTAKQTEISFCRELVNEDQNADKVKIFSAAPYNKRNVSQPDNKRRGYIELKELGPHVRQKAISNRRIFADVTADIFPLSYDLTHGSIAVCTN